MRHLLAGLLAIVLAIGLAAAGIAAWLVQASLPVLDGERRLAGLEAAVTIARDARGIPLIEAASETDAALALGYVHAQDRLWQMELSRRIGAGRLAEIVGEPGLATDRLLRALGLYKAAEAALDHLSPEALALLDAYARGVNAVIEGEGWWRLPPEFLLLRHRPEPWTPADSLVMVKTMALSLVESWRAELLRASLATRLSPEALADLWPPPRADAVTTIPDTLLEREHAAAGEAPLDEAAAAAVAGLAASLLPLLPESGGEGGLGSNVWAVSGAHSASGAGLLANDPHLGLVSPAHWYLAGLRTPEGLVMGATLPSLPAVVIGRNEHIAWGFTNTAGDTEDIIVERLDPDDPGRYLTPDGSAAFATREEVIGVRGGAPVTLAIRSTRNGPVISDILPDAAAIAGDGHALALRWTALEPEDSTIEAGIGLAGAEGWSDFTAAIERFLSPTQNAFYADREGGIGVRLAGRLPLRRGGDGRMPAPGWSGTHDWLGLLPAWANPEGRDPASGYLVNANNRLVGDAYPHLVTTSWNDDLRARRIKAVLEEAIASGRPLDTEAMRRLQHDRRSTLAADFLPYLLAVEPGGERETAILAALAAWDGEAAPDRPEPLIFQAWYRAFVAAVFADELGREFAAWRGPQSDAMRHVLEKARHWCDDTTTPERVESCAERAAGAFATALVELDGRHGADWRRWRWGEASRAVMAHRPFDAVPLLRRFFSQETEGGGDAGTVNVARYRAAEPYASVAGASLRMVADLAEPGTLHVVLPTGQSGHPLSRHFADQRDAWWNGELSIFVIADDAKEYGHILTLVPRRQSPDNISG